MTHTNTHQDPALEYSLFALRLGLAILFLIWGLDKIIQPDHAKAVLAGFYGQNSETMADSIPLALGIAQLSLVALFIAGKFKTITYGLVLALHLVTTIVSLKMHMNPLGSPNILFWANWPILGAATALFLLRERDTRLVLS